MAVAITGAGTTKVAATTRAGVRKAAAAAMNAKTTVVEETTADVNLPVAGVSLPWTGIRNGGSPAKEDVLIMKKEARMVMTKVAGAGGLLPNTVAVLRNTRAVRAVLPAGAPPIAAHPIAAHPIVARQAAARPIAARPAGADRKAIPAGAVHIRVSSATRAASSPAVADVPVMAAAVIPAAAAARGKFSLAI